MIMQKGRPIGRPFATESRKSASLRLPGGGMHCFPSIHEFFDRLIQLVDGLLVAGLHGIGQTVIDVVLQDDLCGVVERRAHGRKLDEHLGAVASVLYHALDRLQVADRTGQAIDDRLGLRVGVRVRVCVPLAAVAVGDDVAVFVHVRVHQRVGILFRHGIISCHFAAILPCFAPLVNANTALDGQ